MTAEIINLRRERRRKARLQDEQHAQANRQKFGRTKADRCHEAATKTLQEAALDGKRRDTGTTAED
ncbi:MAG: DUF4169 family protein [Hyphomicrobiaceae bacterium]